jgi:hypothetical protein
MLEVFVAVSIDIWNACTMTKVGHGPLCWDGALWASGTWADCGVPLALSPYFTILPAGGHSEWNGSWKVIFFVMFVVPEKRNVFFVISVTNHYNHTLVLFFSSWCDVYSYGRLQGWSVCVLEGRTGQLTSDSESQSPTEILRSQQLLRHRMN